MIFSPSRMGIAATERGAHKSNYLKYPSFSLPRHLCHTQNFASFFLALFKRSDIYIIRPLYILSVGEQRLLKSITQAQTPEPIVFIIFSSYELFAGQESETFQFLQISFMPSW